MTKQKQPRKKEDQKNLSGNQQDGSVPGYTKFFSVLAFVVLGMLVYSNSFDCAFQFDDKPNIINNNHIRQFSWDDPFFSLSNSRLMGQLSFALNYHYGQFKVWGYHFFNLLVHLLNTCLVYGLILLIYSTPVMLQHRSREHRNSIALVVALLFVSHPLATQSVTYIVQRLASMVTFFYLAAVYSYIKGRLSSDARIKQVTYFVVAALAAVMAFFTKENSFTLPIAILLVEICFLQQRAFTIHPKDYRMYIVLAVLVAGVGLGLSRFSLSIFKPIPPSFGNDYTLTSQLYLMTQFRVIVKYIQLLLVPVNQNLDHDFPLSSSFWEWQTVSCFLLLAGIFFLAIALFNKQRIISFGLLWFFITLSIESSIVPISDVIFEHRTYLPSFGFLLALIYAGYTFVWRHYPKFALTAVTLLVLTNSVLAYQRNKVWKTDFTLYKDIVSKSPNKSRANSNMARAYYEKGNLDSTIYYYSRAIALNDGYFDAHNNRGIIFAQSKRFEEAIGDFTACIAIDSLNPRSYCNRGNCYSEEGKLEQALIDYSKAIALEGDYNDALVNRGKTYCRLERLTEASMDFQKAVQLDPDNKEAARMNELVAKALGETAKIPALGKR